MNGLMNASEMGLNLEKNMSRRWTTKTFTDKAKIIHNGNYDYSHTQYSDSYSKIKIICPTHGEFLQRANHHIQGHGCPFCTIKVTTDVFVQKAKTIHGNKYDYSQVVYDNKFGKVKIICKHHGLFVQSARNHIRGQNCPRCKNYVSKPEVEFLNLMQVPIESRQIYIGRYKVDGVKGNEIFEFLGDYWHGNPQRFSPNEVNESCNMTFGALLKKTFLKFKSLKEMGYNINYIWEHEWKNYRKQKVPTPSIIQY